MTATHAERIFMCDFSLKFVATFQIWTKIAGTLREDDLDTVMGTDRSVQWTNRQLTKRPAFCIAR